MTMLIGAQTQSFTATWSKAAALCLLLAICGFSWAQSPADKPEADAPGGPSTVLPHPDNTRWYIGGQFNTVFQAHPSFSAKYSGPNSLHTRAESEDSRVYTLYTGLQLSGTTEVLFDMESTSGRGISDALGLAGFTNLDVVRNPELGAKPYIARAMVHQVIPLSRETEESSRGPLSLFTKLPVRRLEIRAGKFSIPDFFDQNDVGSDSHLQFLNWTVDNNGAYDYAADMRGYTQGVVIEYHDHGTVLRFAEARMPKVANGLKLDPIRKARAENMELEIHPKLLAKRATSVRMLGFVNHANMGDYRRAIELFLAGATPTPDITATRQPGTVKYGFGLNLLQEITSNLRAFARVGWNEGRHESFAYTEVDQTIEVGGDLRGARWRRKRDKVGAVLVSNGISSVHQRYLALGGVGFLLGDGRLTYGRETIFEGYYTAHLWRGVFASADVQKVNNPGYNRDRGPVWAPGLRLHVDF
jgi:high affinity Mn2+ porin